MVIAVPDAAESESLVARAEAELRETPAVSLGGGALMLDLVRMDVPRLYEDMNSKAEQRTRAVSILLRLFNWVEKHGRYETKIHYSPPLRLLAAWLREPEDAAGRLHRCYVRQVWQDRNLWGRAGLVAALVTVWPVVNFGMIAWFTALNGSVVRSRTGKGVARQMLEQLRLAVAHSVLPPWYYVFELFRDDNRRHASAYLQRFETKGGVFRILKRRQSAAALSPLQDKVQFATQCENLSIPVIRTMLAAANGQLSCLADDRAPLPPMDLFFKPIVGRGGDGAERWDHRGAGIYGGANGRLLTAAQLLEHLKTISLKRPYIVQPRVKNHPEIIDLSNGALSTVRIITCRNETGGFEATNAVFRMAVGENTVVDNFHAGGIAAAVDMETGRLGAATDLGVRADCGWCSSHPTSGAPIDGRLLPCWAATRALAERAHAAFADRMMIGWDIAILDNGPHVVEANGSPDLDIIQRCEGRPIGNQRFGELLAFHVARCIA